MKKLVAMAMAALVAFGAFADAPTISNVKAQQRYPWNGLVDIDYTITGDTTELNLSFSVTDAQNGKTYKPATFLAPPSAAEGMHRATWSPKDDGLSIFSTNIVVTVLLTRTVVPPEPSGGHDRVQLWEGGPYWATTNIGAEKPEDYGYYFWWGDTTGYKRENDKWVASDGSSSNFSFNSANSPTYKKNRDGLKNGGWITASGVLASTHDAAQVKWGGGWRMPTDGELSALNNKCDWSWTTTNGVNGCIVRGKGDYASASIFLPAGGWVEGTSLNYASSSGHYLSSVPGSDDYNSWCLSFNSGDHVAGDGCRYNGFAVRPVQAIVTITFDANGGAVSSSSRSYVANGTYGSLPTATREGYFFAGWFTAASGGTRVTAGSTVPASATTLCAHWEKVPDKVQLWEGGPYWATTNIGAEKPEDYGYYFWWGDTIGYKRENDKWVASDGSSSNFSFDSANTPTYNKDVATLQSEGWITADGVLAQAHDAAHVQWGGEWRMPTKDELTALNNNCDWIWTTTNGVKGYIVRGRGDYAFASIFLPAAGGGYGTPIKDAGSWGYFWSSVPDSDSAFAMNLYFYPSGLDTSRAVRYRGHSVRPVQGFTE